MWPTRQSRASTDQRKAVDALAWEADMRPGCCASHTLALVSAILVTCNSADGPTDSLSLGDGPLSQGDSPSTGDENGDTYLGGEIVELAVAEDNPTSIALDDTHVFWTNEVGAGAVKKVAKTGGTSTTLSAGNRPDRITTDGTKVYWAQDGTVKAVSVDGGTVSTLATSTVAVIALDSAWVYWTTHLDGDVRRVVKGGGTASVLASGQSPTGLVVDGDVLFWVDRLASKIYELPVTGGTPTVVASSTGDSTMTLMHHAADLYWPNISTAEILKVAKLGGTPIAIATNEFPIGALAVDSSGIYWTRLDDATIRRANLDGTDPVVITTTQTSAFGIALDDTHIYWTELLAGRVVKMAKP